jgi:hypothetical protein
VDVRVLDDWTGCPRVGEAQPAAALSLDPGLGECGADRVAVVEHEPELAALVGSLASDSLRCALFEADPVR